MTTRPHHLLTFLTAGAAALALAACSTSDPLAQSSTTAASGPPSGGTRSAGALVVGSQDYYSNEIVAEVYAQALEGAGYTVQRELRIGQREVYMPEIQDGSIDVFPEYTGNLLQYLDPKTTLTSADDVYAALVQAMPDGLRALDQAEATDQDSYVVTTDFAQKHGGLTAIGDLAGIEGLVLGGNSELESRPYGPDGLSSVYGVQVSFTPVEDSGGPLTVKALRDGDIQLADIYSADPVLAQGDLTVLEDPKSLFLASHVVPIVSSRVEAGAADAINAVSAELTSQDLITMNARSVDDQSPAATIASDWLKEKGLGQ